MTETRSAPDATGWQLVLSGSIGLWLALGLTKFGNPVILDQLVEAPTNFLDLLVLPWPMAWGWSMLIAVMFLSMRFWSWHTPLPRWFLLLPPGWFICQCLSALQTVDSKLSSFTLMHFGTCLAAFWVGLFAFSHVSLLRPFWTGLIGGALAVTLVGWRQHFGGLEAARAYFFSLPNWQDFGPDFVQKVGSDRIYSTLVYPNTFAGVILLLLPITLLKVWEVGRLFGRWGPHLLVGAAGCSSLGCLWWSGSKTGWLIAAGMAALAFFRFTKVTRISIVVLGLTLAVFGTGFWLKNRGYFARGATSVSARVGYWSIAWQSLRARPLLGTGPGTFMVVYHAQRAPEMEMARLAHNDFLQQGSDSGWGGFLAYLGWWGGGLSLLYRNSRLYSASFCVWLGLVAIVAQGCMEFWLYVPAVAWAAFFLLGWQLGCRSGNRIDKSQSSF